jgi:hypothetical protein
MMVQAGEVRMIIKNDPEIDSLNLEDVWEFSKLLVKYLCGEKYPRGLLPSTEQLISEIISKDLDKLISYPQMNEILLLLNQDRISEGFFLFFFENEKIAVNDIKKGISKFRCYAMLSFGNFKFAFQQLHLLSIEEIKETLLPFSAKSSELEHDYTNRPEYILDTMHIERENTFLLGEITFPKLSNELSIINMLSKEETRFTENELDDYYKKVSVLKDEIFPEVQKRGLINTEIYLTWDYMDLYIATSMRNKWEFEETYDFVQSLFPKEKNKANKISDYKLRYFDPTQSKCTHSRDKGLIEGLMLKRVKCTIYMVQESDTFGKDSELASSLAQSNPVIAYVPKYDNYDDYAEKIRKYPLEFFKKRLMLWKSEGVFKDPEFTNKFSLISCDFFEIIDNFVASSTGAIRKSDFVIKQIINQISKDKGLIEFINKNCNGIYSGNIEIIENYLSSFEGELKENDEIFQLSLWDEKEEEFKNSYKDFEIICKILAIIECSNFDKRADTLSWRHPLSVQLDICSGVANGLFVVRTPKQCINLLKNILVNNLEFSIEHVKLFNQVRDNYDILARISGVIHDKFEYDENIHAIYQVKELSESDIEQLHNLKNEDGLSKEEKQVAVEMQKFLNTIEYDGVTILKESISKSPYRVITDNDKLANSFWNLYSIDKLIK